MNTKWQERTLTKNRNAQASHLSQHYKVNVVEHK